jgi:hypothetical protein
LPAKTSVEVRFQYLENGRLTVEAHLPKTKSQAMLEIERAAGLSSEKMASWKEWLEAGAILSATEQEIAPEEEDDEEGESSEALSDFGDEDEESATASEFDFEAIDKEQSEDAEEFDFDSLEEESGSDVDADDEAGDFPAPNSDDEEKPSGMFDGIDTGDEEEKGTVGTDDSDLADFFRDMQ